MREARQGATDCSIQYYTDNCSQCNKKRKDKQYLKIERDKCFKLEMLQIEIRDFSDKVLEPTELSKFVGTKIKRKNPQ